MDEQLNLFLRTVIRKRASKCCSRVDLTGMSLYIVKALINALPGNSSVNTNRDNNRKETEFSMLFAPSKSTYLGNAVVNMHPQK
jgi:hypothetical protein